MVDGNKNKIKTTTYVAVSGGKEGTMRSLLREGSWKVRLLEERTRALHKKYSVTDFCYAPEPNEAWSRRNLLLSHSIEGGLTPSTFLKCCRSQFIIMFCRRDIHTNRSVSRP